jgi:hypothetical protein
MSAGCKPISVAEGLAILKQMAAGLVVFTPLA